MVKMRITLDFELDEADDEIRKEGEFEGELPSVDEISATEFGDIVAAHMDSADEEIWAGSEMYAKITSVHCSNAVEL